MHDKCFLSLRSVLRMELPPKFHILVFIVCSCVAALSLLSVHGKDQQNWLSRKPFWLARSCRPWRPPPSNTRGKALPGKVMTKNIRRNECLWKNGQNRRKFRSNCLRHSFTKTVYILWKEARTGRERLRTAGWALMLHLSLSFFMSRLMIQDKWGAFCKGPSWSNLVILKKRRYSSSAIFFLFIFYFTFPFS